MSEGRSTRAVIEPIIKDTYGKWPISDALVEHLVGRIENDWQGYRDRERQIMLTCWDWFPGGNTAASVARKIEQALTQEEEIQETS